MGDTIRIICMVYDRDDNTEQSKITGVQGPLEAVAAFQENPDEFFDWLEANDWRANPGPTPITTGRLLMIYTR